MRIAILAGLVLLAGAPSAYALDCTHPGTPPSAVVCSDAALQKLLKQRESAYHAAFARSNAEARQALAQNTREWLKSYQASCGIAAKGPVPSPVGKALQRCVAQAFEARIGWLEHYPPAQGAPAGKAVRAALPAHAPAAKAALAPAAHAARRAAPMKLTFACRTPAELAQVMQALARHDFSYPLNQPDCVPLAGGQGARVVSVNGKLAKLRLCSGNAGCIEVYADAASIHGGERKVEPGKK